MPRSGRQVRSQAVNGIFAMRSDALDFVHVCCLFHDSLERGTAPWGTAPT